MPRLDLPHVKTKRNSKNASPPGVFAPLLSTRSWLLADPLPASWLSWQGPRSVAAARTASARPLALASAIGAWRQVKPAEKQLGQSLHHLGQLDLIKPFRSSWSRYSTSLLEGYNIQQVAAATPSTLFWLLDWCFTCYLGEWVDLVLPLYRPFSTGNGHPWTQVGWAGQFEPCPSMSCKRKRTLLNHRYWKSLVAEVQVSESFQVSCLVIFGHAISLGWCVGIGPTKQLN